MKYGLSRTKRFKKSYKKLHLKDDDEAVYIDVVSNLLNGVALVPRHKDYYLKGDFEGYRECHLKPDLLLIYRIHEQKIQLVDIGSHSDLFK